MPRGGFRGPGDIFTLLGTRQHLHFDPGLATCGGLHPLPMPPPSFAPPGGGTALLTLEGILAPARKMGRRAHGRGWRALGQPADLATPPSSGSRDSHYTADSSSRVPVWPLPRSRGLHIICTFGGPHSPFVLLSLIFCAARKHRNLESNRAPACRLPASSGRASSNAL